MSTNTTNERDPTKLIAAAIDFGNSAIRAAVLDGSNIVRIVPNKNMEQETLSIVAYTDPIAVGTGAIFSCLEEPDIAIFDLKDLIGSNLIEEQMKTWPFKFIHHDGEWKIRVNHRDEEKLLTPIEVTKKLFQEVIHNIMSNIKEESIEQLILTIPPHFTSNHRKALLEVVQREEFKNVLLMTNVTAILYRHTMQHRKGEQLKDANYIVYSFGSSSFDCAVFSVRSGEIRSRQILSRTDVSGNMYTRALMLYIVNQTPLKDLAVIDWNTKKWSRFMYEAEKIKKMLSYKSQVVFKWSSLGVMSNSTVNINAGDMEEIGVIKSSEIIAWTQEVLAQSALNKSDIDQVFLSGGASHMPFISNILKNYFDADRIVTSENREMDAVIGAAMYSREIIPERRTYHIRHLAEIGLPNIVARNIATDQSQILVKMCDNWMGTHIARGVFRTDGDLINFEISETYPNGEKVVIGKYTKELTIPYEEEVALEFTILIDRNGIVTVTNISTFMLGNAPFIYGNTTSVVACNDNRTLVDSDEDTNDDDVTVKSEPNINNIGYKRDDNCGGDTNHEDDSKNEHIDGVENHKHHCYEREDDALGGSNVNSSPELFEETV